MTMLLNILTVAPANRDQLLEMLHHNIKTVIHTLDGWISTDLIASADGKRVLIHSKWRDDAAVAAMRADPRMLACFPKLAALASFDAIVGELVHEYTGGRADGDPSRKQA